MWDLILSVPDHCLSFYLVILEYSMQHTKFQGHRPSGSREEETFMLLSYIGMAAILVM